MHVTSTTASTREQLGQYFTSKPIARFLASLFAFPDRSVRLLDPGAGNGALTAAVVERLCTIPRLASSISSTTVELDPKLWEVLAASGEEAGRACRKAGIGWESLPVHGSFFDFALAHLREDFFSPTVRRFNAAILNPPYRKIHSDSRERQQLRAAGLETSNLYTGFLYLAARLLEEGGELVAIVPRSFCNGPYFRPFREQFFSMMSLRRLHLFESRTEAFRDVSVLQENIILHAVKCSGPPAEVTVSSSIGDPHAHDPQTVCAYAAIFDPHDPERFLHIPNARTQTDARRELGKLSGNLADLGVQVSTGRVVDFRARALLRSEPEPGSYPLIYPCHCRGGRIVWPGEEGKKPNAIASAADEQNLLVPTAHYVLTKRFTSKEERRRVVATLFEPESVPSPKVAFENHLNYFHARGCGLPPTLAAGLAAFLNSTAVDRYFRQFNGHTQVNATDLRNLPYPRGDQLRQLGAIAGNRVLVQHEIDTLVAEHLLS